MVLKPLISLIGRLYGHTSTVTLAAHARRGLIIDGCTRSIDAGWPRPACLVTSNGVFRRQCWPLVDLYLGVFDWKVQRFCWPKGKSLECVESKTMETACVSNELTRYIALVILRNLNLRGWGCSASAVEAEYWFSMHGRGKSGSSSCLTHFLTQLGSHQTA